MTAIGVTVEKGSVLMDYVNVSQIVPVLKKIFVNKDPAVNIVGYL